MFLKPCFSCSCTFSCSNEVFVLVRVYFIVFIVFRGRCRRPRRHVFVFMFFLLTYIFSFKRKVRLISSGYIFAMYYNLAVSP